MVGRLVPIKDVPTFLRAARLVRAAHASVRFALVGDGEERPALERLAAELGVGDAVVFAGWRSDLGPVYGDLDVVVNASRNEGTPVALIEAMAAGRPVVATRVGGTPDLLGGGARGRLVPAGEPEALARAVLETLDDRADHGHAHVRAARDHVLERHSLERLVGDVDTLYRELGGRAEAA